MITMINERNGYQTRFKNYRKLYSHINSQQWVKRYNRPYHLIDDWFFACHSHRRVMAFYKFISAHAQKYVEKTSDDQQPRPAFLEVSRDCSRKPIIMPIKPNLDIESLLKDWCQRYCAFHGYKLIEIQNDDGVLHVKKIQHHSPDDEQDFSF